MGLLLTFVSTVEKTAIQQNYEDMVNPLLLDVEIMATK